MKRTFMVMTVVGGLGGGAVAEDLDKVPAQPVIAPESAAHIPEAGMVFAVLTDHAGDTRGGSDDFAISRITRKGLVDVFRETRTEVDRFKWLDGSTLVVLDGDDSRRRVRWFVDGKLDASRTVEVTAADWKLPGGKALPEYASIELAVGKSRDVWLAVCLDEDRDGSRCKSEALLRVGAGPFTIAKKRPKGVVNVGGVPVGPGDGVALPKLKKAPAGFTVKLSKVKISDPDAGDATVKGFTCATGGKTVSWPQPGFSDWGFDIRPDKVQWVSAAPPIFWVEGNGRDPIDRTFRERRYFHGCAPAAMHAFFMLGDGLWAELKPVVNDTTMIDWVWIVSHEDRPVAVVVGSPYAFAFAPR